MYDDDAAATSGPGGAHQPEGSPRCLDEGRHHPGVFTEHENESKEEKKSLKSLKKILI